MSQLWKRPLTWALVATITRVRRKLAAAGAPDAIHTVRGLGYRLETAELRVRSG